MLKVTRLFLHGIAIILSGVLGAAAYATTDAGDFPGQVTVDVQQVPVPLKALDKYYLVYEVNLVNYQKIPITLKSLTISSDKGHVMTYSGKDLAGLMYGAGVKNPESQPLLFQPGKAKMIYLFLPFSNEASLPAWLTHDITFTMGKDVIQFKPEVKSDPLNLGNARPTIVASPLRGDYWLAGNAPSNTSPHRTTHLIYHGHDYFAQRYAIDFVQIGKNGITHSGNPAENKNYYAYGHAIFSVANGRVVEVKDNLPENTPRSGKLAVPLSSETICGNHVVVDLGHGQYALYAHMIPGSIKVKTGDSVTRGQVLGKVGNTGNSSEPHLHFQIMDRSTPLGGNGLPYGFEHFSVHDAKSIPDKNEEIRMEILSDKLTPYQNQLVLEDTLMKFDEE